MACTPEEYLIRFEDIERLREKYYTALNKTEDMSINLYLKDEIRNIDVFETESVKITTKKILVQANFCRDLKEQYPEAEQELDMVETYLRYVVGGLRRHLKNYHNVSAKYTADLDLKFI